MTFPLSASRRTVLLPVVLAATLVGCVTVPSARVLAPEQQAVAERQQATREAELQRQTDWSLAGRIAVSNGGNGGSGRIDWTQDRAGYRVALSAPVTRQSWQLSVDGATGAARLDGLDGGPRTGSDAALLLREATGWDIPVTALGDWVRGLRASTAGASVIQFGPDLRPARIAQGGWDIVYTWPGAATADALPARIDARRGDARVRLIVDQWGEAGDLGSR
jgi:outer membrane lipoprotein LolB